MARLSEASEEKPCFKQVADTPTKRPLAKVKP